MLGERSLWRVRFGAVTREEGAHVGPSPTLLLCGRGPDCQRNGTDTDGEAMTSGSPHPAPAGGPGKHATSGPTSIAPPGAAPASAPRHTPTANRTPVLHTGPRRKRSRNAAGGACCTCLPGSTWDCLPTNSMRTACTCEFAETCRTPTRSGFLASRAAYAGLRSRFGTEQNPGRPHLGCRCRPRRR